MSAEEHHIEAKADAAAPKFYPKQAATIHEAGYIVVNHRRYIEAKADAAAPKTYPQQAETIREAGYIVINDRPCKVVFASTFKFGPKYRNPKCRFVGIDLFTLQWFKVIVPCPDICDVPYVDRTDYQLIGISEDGFVSLRTESGGIKDDVRLPTHDSLRTRIKDWFAAGKHLVVSVMCAMGEEHIVAVKEIGPK